MKARIDDRVVYSPYPRVEIPVCSFYTLAKEQLNKNPDSLALVDDVLRLTRAELLVRCQRYAVGFRRHGVKPGDLIGIQLNNSVENLAAVLGCIFAGATIVLVKTSLTEQEIRSQVQDFGSMHILTEVQFTERVAAATTSLDMKGLFSMGPAVGFVTTIDFLTLDEKEFQEFHVVDPKNTLLGVCYTSGSTGLPKGVEISHYNYVGAFYTCREVLPWRTTEISLGSNPITHLSGLLFQIFPVLNGAVGAVVSATSTPIQLMDAIDRHKVVDTITGEKLGPKQMGQICFHSAFMVRGYYKNPKESAELFDKDGWMKSGDCGFYDEEGRLYYSERLKQMIKCMDNQVVPGELEELLLLELGDEIAEVSVVGLPHDEYGEAAAAAIVLTENGMQQDRSDFADKIKATIADKLSVHKHLHGGVFFMESFPRTESSKVDRIALAGLLLINLNN